MTPPASTLVKLHAKGLRALSPSSDRPFLGRVCERPEDSSDDDRAEELLLVDGAAGTPPPGFRAYLLRERADVTGLADCYLLGADHGYVRVGDVLRVDPARGELSALFRAGSRANSLLVTERCDHRCVMCSQPPKERDDSWLVDELEAAIPLIRGAPAEVGITGGEPTLLGRRFVALLLLLRDHLPATSVHVLTHGRRFADEDFTRAVASVGHPDLMMGVPLYGDLPEDHDFVVQSRGAFDETVRGVIALKRAGVPVELRFVIHRDTVDRLADFARFVARNLTFVDHVALMGLEPVGYARANLDRLWVDPVDYQGPLVEAAHTLRRAGMNVSLYNHQLCVLDPRLHPLAKRSISDWKNRYFDECEGCSAREECGGFFASAEIRRSRGITPLSQRATP